MFGWFLDFIDGVAWAAFLWWLGKNLPGLVALLIGFVGLVVAFWRHRSEKSGFRLSPRYFRDWLIVIFGAALCALGLLIVFGIVEPG